MIFFEISKQINEDFIKTNQKPIAIRVNGEWLEKQIHQTFILRNPNENPLETFTGVKVHVDNSISTFELVYE